MVLPAGNSRGDFHCVYMRFLVGIFVNQLRIFVGVFWGFLVGVFAWGFLVVEDFWYTNTIT